MPSLERWRRLTGGGARSSAGRGAARNRGRGGGRGQAGSKGGAFDPASALFGAGEEGAWYDPSDLSTLFQDAGKTTPVTTTGQSVKVMADKSGNGLDLVGTGTGPLLQQDGNGNYYLDFEPLAYTTMLATFPGWAVPIYWCSGIKVNQISALRSMFGGTAGPWIQQWSLSQRLRFGNRTLRDVDGALVDQQQKVLTVDFLSGAASGARKNGTELFANADIGATALSALQLNQPVSSTYADFWFYGLIITRAPFDKALVEAWMAAKNGATLA